MELVVAEAVAQARISLVAVAVCITRVVLEPLLQPSTQDSLLFRRWALVEEAEVPILYDLGLTVRDRNLLGRGFELGLGGVHGNRIDTPCIAIDS